MNGKTIKVLSVIAGVLLIAAGVVCLMNQDVAVLSAGVLIGIFMLCSGILEVVMFSYGRKLMLGSGWLLLDGILTVLLSLFLLFNQAFTMVYLPILFSMWLLFSGVSKFVTAFDLQALRVRGWGWVMAFGLILMVFGFVALMDPWLSTIAMGITIGIVFILQGIDAIVCVCIASRRD